MKIEIEKVGALMKISAEFETNDLIESFCKGFSEKASEVKLNLNPEKITAIVLDMLNKIKEDKKA